MGHEQLVVYQKNIRFHAGEAVGQGIEQGTVVPVIIVGVGPCQWRGFLEYTLRIL